MSNFIFTFLVIITCLFMLGLVIGLRAAGRDKQTEKANQPTPSTILVDTIGTIILREADRVELETNRGMFVDSLINYTCTFKYDNVNICLKAYNFSRQDNTFNNIIIDRIDFSVGEKKNISLTDNEEKKLYEYLRNATDIKQAKIEAEKEKQRQLDACDALENLMKPELPKLETAGHGEGASLGKYSVNHTSTGNTTYFTTVSST